MRKLIVVIAVLALFLVSSGSVLAGSYNAPGPNPDAGDGISDGSSLDSPYGANSAGDIGTGPAPNAGDGIPDGSGL